MTLIFPDILLKSTYNKRRTLYIHENRLLLSKYEVASLDDDNTAASGQLFSRRASVTGFRTRKLLQFSKY